MSRNSNRNRLVNEAAKATAQTTEAVAKVKKPIVSEETVEIAPEKEVIVPEIDLSAILASLPADARKLIEEKLAKAEKKSQKPEKVLVEVGKVRYLNNKEHEITRRVKIQEADNGEVWVTYLDAYQLSDEEIQTLSFKPAYLPYVNTEDAKKAEKVSYAENAEEIEKEIF